ncbi:MAG: DNA topoisomerase I [Planctomycetes bacterium GWF2_50_10]|nr:MAG: DNA topoisomerase I [Planctomycetes bacterium GWF2_50_10]
MAKKTSGSSLVIVESPAKAKTINKYLGSGYEVLASMGHVRDLPSKGISVDIDHNFEPTYEIVPGRRKVLANIKSAAKKVENLYLATDLDREGEAIAWHLAQVLGFPEDKTFRVVFNAITKSAIQEAFSHPGKIDNDKVNAQQARRILDRIVGYQISPLLWKKVARGLSAGRVQSVAVKIIVEREREIRNFKEQEYWLLPAVFTTDLSANYTAQWQKFLTAGGPDTTPTVAQQAEWLTSRNAFKAEINKVGAEKFHAENETDAMRVFDSLKNAQFKVASIETKRSSSRPAPPFITSTLQQAAANRLGFSTKRTMIIAQQLYEGIDLGSMGMLGLITYMRTDSTFISSEAIRAARTFIENKLGKDYVPEKPNFFAPSQAAQQAHEAVRPTDPDLDPEHIKEFLTDEQYKLYDLIWRRFVASQIAPAQWDVTTLDITAQTAIGPISYRASGRVQIFDGFTRLWPTTAADQQLPAMKQDDILAAIDLEAQKHFTKPPARYTEASLVKALEKEGIGRPSTYASIISTIQDRGYVEQLEKKFHATATGEVVTDKLNDFFPQIMDITFTRYMEEQLDKIEVQHLDWVKVLSEFYGPFKENLEKAGEEMKHAKAELIPSEYNCPICNSQMMYRFGKNGRFLSCSKYPECKGSAPIDQMGKIVTDQVTEHTCPNCGKKMIKKHGPFGAFLRCEGHPDCKTILKFDKKGNIKPPAPPAELSGIRCQKCKTGELLIRQGGKGPFLACNKFPRCRNIVGYKNFEQLKELQAQGKWPPATLEEADAILGRKPKKGGKTK